MALPAIESSPTIVAPVVEQVARETRLMCAFNAKQAELGDANPGIWSDPNGCEHYIADRGDAGAVLAPLLAADATPF